MRPWIDAAYHKERYWDQRFSVSILTSYQGDNTAIYYRDKSWKQLKVEKDISSVKNWFDCKLVAINLTKTKYIAFTYREDHLPSFDSLNVFEHSGSKKINSIKK